jgi:anti-sigma B factor antagonist
MADLEGGAAAAEVTLSTRVDPGGTCVVSLAGELDSSNVDTVSERLATVVADRPERVIFDLAGLRFMDSAGIAVLIRTAADVDTVQIRDPSPIVKRVIEVTGLSDVLRIVT